MKKTMANPERSINPDALWQQQMLARKALMDKHGGNFARFTVVIPQLYQAFGRNELGELDLTGHKKVVCIDEGTVGGVHIAGSGILEGVDATAAMLENLEIDVIHSHGGCGAAALFASLNGIDTKDPDTLGAEFAYQVAERLGARHHHIRREQLRRPPMMHNATLVYYSGIKVFDPTSVEGLPSGFVVNRAIRKNPKPAQDEAGIATQIAFGNHGFGDRFTPVNPLIIVPIGNPHRPELGTDVLTDELQPLVKAFGARVLISGFTSPF